ncbi:MAG TPA: phosphatase PAP2 family protein [Flavihumibacter sp.]|nr:phosphatase PAP2 family protein [Flavihumibacter sp.]HQD09461.1 phosphatase PAP2 family protein [Flavihumibacter sp.]
MFFCRTRQWAVMVFFCSLANKALAINDTLIVPLPDTLISLSCDTVTPPSRDTLISPSADSIPAYRSPEWYQTKGYRINKAYLASYVSDFPKVVTAPARYDRRDWITVGVSAAGAGLLLLADKPIHRFMDQHHTAFLNSAANLVQPFGNSYPPMIIAGMYAAGLIAKDRRLEHASLMAAKSMLFSTVIYATTKKLIRRQRPTYTDNNLDFRAPFYGGKPFTSFPSGHTNTVFALATTLAMEYKDKKWVPIVAYSIASLTAVSRLYQDRHWASDVWVGAAFGHFITRGLYKVEEWKNRPAQKRELKF